MRKLIAPLMVVIGLACRGETPTGSNYGLSPPPPTPSVSATSHTQITAGGAPELVVSALLTNSTLSHFQVSAGAACPFAVRIFPDSTGANEFIGVVPCPAGGSTFDLAPGDTTTLTRVFSADTLATLAAGTYGINVQVATNTVTIGVWAGAIQLPLKSSP